MVFADKCTVLMSSIWPPLADVRVGRTAVAVYPSGSTYGPRVARDHKFIWIIEGRGTIQFDHHKFSVLPGTILLCQAGVTDRYDWTSKTPAMHAFFHFELPVPVLGWPPVKQWPVSHHLPSDDVLRPLFRYVLRVHSLAEPLRSSLLMPCLDLMLRSFISGELTTAAEPTTKLPPPVERTLRLICERVFREPSLGIAPKELPLAAHVSAEHLCRLFRETLDLTPTDCVRLARLERAATQLWRSDLAIREISDSVGFSSQYYFSKAFQKVYGITPRAFRKAAREGLPKRPNPIVRFLKPIMAPSGG